MRTVRVGGALLLLLISALSLVAAAAHVASRHSRLAAPRPAVLSSSPVAPTAPLAVSEGAAAALVFETTEVDLGRLAPGEVRRVEVPWRRAGPGTLRVREVAPGCGCVVARGLEGALEAGATGALVFEIAGRARAGPFAETVRVLTDRPPDDVHTLRLRGFVGDGVVVSPGALSLGPLRPGERLVRWLTVRSPPGGFAPAVDAKLAGLSGTIRGLPPGRPGAVGWDLEISLRAPLREGPFSGSLAVRVEGQAPVHVPVDGTVEGEP